MAAKTTVKVSLTNNAAKDDSFSEANYSWLNENGSLKGDLNVLANDPGSAKLLGVSDVLPTTQSELTNGSDTVKAMFNNVVYDIKITANADGTVNFDASSLQAALQSLHGDEVFSTSFYYTVQMANGTYSTAKVDIVIGGEDDAATFSGDTTGAVVEDTTTSVSGDLNVSDLDHDQSGFQAASAADLAGDYGNFTFNEATGAWSYMLDHDLADSLYAGQIVYETLTVKSTDGTTQNIVVKVTGTNDDPVLTVDNTGSVTEDAGDTLTDSGTLSFNDVDNGDTHTFSAALDSVSGDITISAALQTALESAMSADNNSWDFSLDNSLVQGLGAGEKITVTYKVTVADNHGGSDTETVTVTINGTNDQPTLTLVSNNGSVTEDTSNPNLTVSGALSSTDADLNDIHSFSASFASAVGNNGASVSAGLLTALQSAMSADSNSWDFSVANSLVQYLNSGQSVTVTYNVTATDDSGTGTASDTKMVTITLNGVDEPVVIMTIRRDRAQQPTATTTR
jgi:VCBS repeat-containing protein